MKKFLYIALGCSMLLSLNSCDWFNTTILGKPSKAEIAKKIRLENQRKDSLARVQQEAALLLQQQEAEAAAKVQEEAQQLRYHVMVGSFKVQANAERMTANLESKGFRPATLHFKNGFTGISAQSFSDIHAAYNAMNALMLNTDFAPGDIWVYDTNQQLHQ